MAAVSSWSELQQSRSNTDFLIFLHASGSRRTALATSSFVTWSWGPRWGESTHYFIKPSSHSVVRSLSSFDTYKYHRPMSRPVVCPLVSDAFLIFDGIELHRVVKGFIYLFLERKEWNTPEGMENRERKREEKPKMREVAMQLAFLSHLGLLAWPHLDGLTCSSTAWCNLHCPEFDFSPCAGWTHI